MPVPSGADDVPPPYSEINRTNYVREIRLPIGTHHPMERVTVTVHAPPPPYSELDPARNSGRLESATVPQRQLHNARTIAAAPGQPFTTRQRKIIYTLLLIIYVINFAVNCGWALMKLVDGKLLPLCTIGINLMLGGCSLLCIHYCML